MYCMYVFHCFSSFYAQERIAPVALRSVNLFLRVTGAIRSCCSVQKSIQEKIVIVALYKIVTVSDSLTLLFTKERWKRFALFHAQIALSLTKNSLEKPKSKFPSLIICNVMLSNVILTADQFLKQK